MSELDGEDARDAAEREILAATVLSVLEEHEIHYEMCTHPPVYTVEEASRLVPVLPGCKTKNLFLRDKKGKRHFLCVVCADAKVDLVALSSALEVNQLSLASPERLLKHLGITPGAVSLLALVTDKEAHAVELVVDAKVWKEAAVLCHPKHNAATLVMSHESCEQYIAATGHTAKVLDVPVKE